MNFMRAIKVYPLEGMEIGALFIDGTFKKYDLKPLIKKWPIFKKLQNRHLFNKARLDVGGLGIIWNKEIDLAANDVYYFGKPWKDAPLIDVDVMQAIIALKDARIKQRMSQTELAEKSGLKQANIARFESGKHFPTLDTLLRVAKVLGLTLQWKKQK